jgi:hypothetical protein
MMAMQESFCCKVHLESAPRLRIAAQLTMWLTCRKRIPLRDSELANTDATMSRILLNCYISGTFIAFQYLVCLTYIFLTL